MTSTGDDGRAGPSPVDADFVSNLDALSRTLDDIEALADAALEGEQVDGTAAHRLAHSPASLGYAELTAHHHERRELEAWGEVEMADILQPAALRQLDDWRAAQRLPWERSDVLAVGMSGLIGALANLYDTQIDAAVAGGLGWLKQSDLLRQWERDTARLPIDYTGPRFGGPAHRVRSAGHDIGRFFTALQQVRSGEFQGTWWEDGQRMVETITTTRSGRPFASATEPHLAMVLVVKHWAADFVTPMSLPLPGWSLLYEMPSRDLREFAHAAYSGTNRGDGLNLRSGVLTPGLGMVASDVIIRTSTHLTAYRETGSPRLESPEVAKRNEMLLAAHAAAGAVSLSRTVAAAVTGETAFAVRHLNLPVLMRVGMLALQVRADAADRTEAGAPSWERLLRDEAETWTLPEAVTIAELLCS